MLWHFFSKNNASEKGGVAPNLRHGNERAWRFYVFNHELHELHDWAMLSGKRVISCNSCNSWLKPTWLRSLARGDAWRRAVGQACRASIDLTESRMQKVGETSRWAWHDVLWAMLSLSTLKAVVQSFSVGCTMRVMEGVV